MTIKTGEFDRSFADLRHKRTDVYHSYQDGMDDGGGGDDGGGE